MPACVSIKQDGSFTEAAKRTLERRAKFFSKASTEAMGGAVNNALTEVHSNADL